MRKFETAELDKLPPKHAARSNPELTISRRGVRELGMDRFTRLLNREEVVFDGEDPVTTADTLKQDMEEVTQTIREAREFLAQLKAPDPPAPPPARFICEEGYRTKEEIIEAGNQGWHKRCAQFFIRNKKKNEKTIMQGPLVQLP